MHAKSCLCCCNERTCVNTYINKSLVQVLESCPSSDVTSPAALPTLVPLLVKAGLANAYIYSHKLDAILREPCSYYGSAFVPKWPQKQSQSI